MHFRCGNGNKGKSSYICHLNDNHYSLSRSIDGIHSMVYPILEKFPNSNLCAMRTFSTLFFLLDESIRWLLITGRKNEAKDIIKQAAKMNNVDITEAEMDNISYAKRNEGDIELLKALKATFSS